MQWNSSTRLSFVKTIIMSNCILSANSCIRFFYLKKLFRVVVFTTAYDHYAMKAFARTRPDRLDFRTVLEELS